MEWLPVDVMAIDDYISHFLSLLRLIYQTSWLVLEIPLLCSPCKDYWRAAASSKLAVPDHIQLAPYSPSVLSPSAAHFPKPSVFRPAALNIDNRPGGAADQTLNNRRRSRDSTSVARDPSPFSSFLPLLFLLSSASSYLGCGLRLWRPAFHLLCRCVRHRRAHAWSLFRGRCIRHCGIYTPLVSQICPLISGPCL